MTATAPKKWKLKEPFKAYRVSLCDIASREEFLETCLAHLDNPEFAMGTRQQINKILRQEANRRLGVGEALRLRHVLLLTDDEKALINPSTVERFRDVFRRFGIDF